MSVWYSEFHRGKAFWLRELMECGAILPGAVDERDLRDVRPDELVGYRELHWCAGIGVWSYALREAGWPAEWPIWTASLPCQPFSTAGKRKGTADERHLWPSFFWFIRQLGPRIILGEQVSSRDGLAWWGTVQGDLESEGYACAALDLCSPCVGAPHLRQRLYWCAVRMADAHLPDRGADMPRGDDFGGADSGREKTADRPQSCGEADGMANSEAPIGRGSGGAAVEGRRNAETRGSGVADGMGHSLQAGRQGRQSDPSGRQPEIRLLRQAGATNGYWGDCLWAYCRDHKFRPVPVRAAEPGSLPLAGGATRGLVRVRDQGGEGYEVFSPLVRGSEARTLRLHGYGDAICAPLAVEYIKTVMDVLGVAK